MSVSKALEDITLDDLKKQVRALQEQLQLGQKEAAESKRELDETRAQLSVKAFGFDYASRTTKVVKFYSGLHIQDFEDFRSIISDSADRMKHKGAAEEHHDGRHIRGPARMLSDKDELFPCVSYVTIS